MSTIEAIGNVKIRAALVLAAVFIIGVAAGAALWHALMSPPKMPPPMRGPLPFHKLGLSADQHEKVDAVLEAHRPALDAVLDDTYPKIRAINQEIEKEVLPMLTEDQRNHLKEIKARRSKNPHRHMRGRGRHGPRLGPRMDPRSGPSGPPPGPPPLPPKDGPPLHDADSEKAPGDPPPKSPGAPSSKDLEK